MLKILGHDSTTTENLSPADALVWRDRPEARLWLDGWALSPAETTWLHEEWGIARRHLVDGAAPPNAPYVDAYPDYIFGQLPLPDAAQLEAMPAGISFCLGRRFLLTLHGGPLPPLTDLWAERAAQAERWRYGLDELLARLLSAASAAARAGSDELLSRWQARRTLPAGWLVYERHRYLTTWQVAAYQWQATLEHLATISGTLASLTHPALDANVQHELKRLNAQLEGQQRSLAAASAAGAALLPALRQRLTELNMVLVIGSGLILFVLLALIILLSGSA